MNPPGTVHSQPRLYREDRGGFCRTERETRPVYRVQCAQGRGPYRPGFSHTWVDKSGPNLAAPWFVELGIPMQEAIARCVPGYHYGCGFVSLEQFHNWFTPRELRRLERLGYALVTVYPDVIIAETPTQVVFGTKAPLREAAPRIRLTSRRASPASIHQHGDSHV